MMRLFSLLSLPAVSSAHRTKPQFRFYFESLCQGCRLYQARSRPGSSPRHLASPVAQETTIKPLFDSGFLTKHVDFAVVPWGNARANATGVTCQHGPEECRLNEVFNCAIDSYPNAAVHFPYIACVEAGVSAGCADCETSCAATSGVDASVVGACVASGRGAKLHRKAGWATAALVPAHRYVPWAVVNGVPLQSNDGDLLRILCVAISAASGADLPSECVAYDPAVLGAVATSRCDAEAAAAA